MVSPGKLVASLDYETTSRTNCLPRLGASSFATAGPLREASNFAGPSFRGVLTSAVQPDQRADLGRWQAEGATSEMPDRYSQSRLLAAHRVQRRRLISTSRTAAAAVLEGREVCW